MLGLTTIAALLSGPQRLDEALAGCDKAIALKPDYGAYNNRGILSGPHAS
jgi:hypothetical protein